MKSHFIPTSALLVGLLAFAFSSNPAAYGCTCCTVSTTSDWETQGYSVQAGFKLDVNYSFLDQTQLRSGTRKVSPSEVPDGQELEKSTRNHYTNLSLDYVFNSDWGAGLELPWISRDHATLGEDHHELDTSSTNSLGDLKLMGRYQGFTGSHHFGVTLGLKLPTGSFNESFRSGETLDRGLQPGTGTTDLIAGVYYFDKLSENWGCFGQALVQTALNSRTDYQPGAIENLNLGVRYTGIAGIIPQLQLNGRNSNRDAGEDADILNSGGFTLYLSPGVTFELNAQLSTYIFAQVPLYQNLNGFQLAPTWGITAGVRYAF